ncbi:MAG TPA: hypothetical protein VLC09_14160 [Polyangiaceae bacterium]|nr:hypothetical protein [Polyangiaceae bacterium]
MKRIIVVGIPSVAFLLGISSSAHAQDASERTAAIEAFDAGQALVAEGQLTRACPRFAESQRLDPQLGTLLHLADCYERNGQLASAWLGFREAGELAQQKGDPRQSVAIERASALRPRLTQLRIELPTELPAGTTVKRNGTALKESQWGLAVALDPATYEVEVAASGYETFVGRIEVRGEGETLTFTVPLLVASGSSAAKGGATDGASSSQAAAQEGTSVWEAKWPALVAAGVGVAGGVVWTVFGIQALDAKARADQGCDLVGETYTCRDSDSQQASEDAAAAGDIATIGMIATGVGLATAGVLWFTLPDSAPTTNDRASSGIRGRTVTASELSFGVRPFGAELRGTF